MKPQLSKTRAAIASTICVCIIYFALGGLLVLIGCFSPERYFAIGGVAGGIASVLGLFALTRPGISQSDLAQIEADSLRTLAETTEKIKELEHARATTKKQIHTLELQKQEMELLVQKASLSIFLREQKRLYERRIQEEIEKNRELDAHIRQLASIDHKLAALDEEIEADPNVVLVKEIIASAKRETDNHEDYFETLPPLTRAALRAMSIVTKDLVRTMRLVLAR